MVNDTSGHDIDSWLAIDVAETDKVFPILNINNNTFKPSGTFVLM